MLSNDIMWNKGDPYVVSGIARGAEMDRDAPERLIVRVARDGDRSAFIMLFNHFAPRVKSYLIKGGLKHDAADEIAQDVMLSVWRKADLYDPEQSSASTWIFTIARNRRIDFLRRETRSEIDMQDPMLVGAEPRSPRDTCERAEQAEIMLKALDSLPAEQADILYKAYYEDKTHEAIARENKLPIGTVKSRIRLALDRLRKQDKVRQAWK